MEEEDISELYNFNYNLVYHKDIEINIDNEVKENKSQYEYDLSQIISRPDNDDLYNVKLFGIFTILNDNIYAKCIFNLLRKKMPEEFQNETSTYHNIRLFYQILSYDFLYLYHPCICDIYHDNVIKPENLHKLINFLNNIKQET